MHTPERSLQTSPSLRLISTALLTLLSFISPAHADVASVEEAAWFAGQWTVGPAPVEGFETIAGQDPMTAQIRVVEGSTIERRIRIQGTDYTLRYEVRSFGGNFPWWGENGGNFVAKKVDEDRFHLAPVSIMGKAEWTKGWEYKRVPAEGELTN